MASSEQDFISGLDLLGDIDRQRAAVLREFEKASLAQMAHMQRMIDEDPSIIERFVTDLTRASQMSEAASYLAQLNIPGYQSELEAESDELVRDRAAVVLEIFAPDHPEYATWRDLVDFDFNAAVGRLGASAVPVHIVETSTPIDPTVIETAPSVDAAEPEASPSEGIDTADEEPVEQEVPKIEVQQMLYDGTVLPMSDQAAELLIALRSSEEQLTIGRMRKALGDEDLDASEIRDRIKQINRAFSNVYEGELVENLGKGWYDISSENKALLSTQVVLVDADPGAPAETQTNVEVAGAPIITATYKGKKVTLEHEAHFAVLRAIQAGDGLSSEQLKAHPDVAAFADQFTENQFRNLPRDAVQSAQRIFAREFDINVTEVSAEESNLPGEFSEQTGVVHIAGRRRGRRYHSTDALKAVKFKLEYKAGEAIAGPTPEADAVDPEAQKKALSAMSYEVVKLLRDSEKFLSQSDILAALTPEGASENERKQLEQLIIQATGHVRNDLKEALEKRGLRFETSAVHTDTAHYTIRKIEEAQGTGSDAADAQERMQERRRARRGEGGQDDEPRPAPTEQPERAPRVMDGQNKLTATYALVDGERRAFTPHEAAIVAILGERHYKRGIDAAGIYNILKPRDGEITRGDIDAAISGIQAKLRSDWLVTEREGKQGPSTIRFASKVGVKSHGPRK